MPTTTADWREELREILKVSGPVAVLERARDMGCIREEYPSGTLLIHPNGESTMAPPSYSMRQVTPYFRALSRIPSF